MYVQTEITPNPNSLKFIPGKAVSNSGPLEITKKEEINNELVRNLLLPFPATLKFTVFRSLLGEYKAGLAMDVLGATIAHRYEPAEVDGWLAELGFQHVIQTIATNEIYRKAFHAECSAHPFFLDPPVPPYWFEQWRQENYQNLARRDMYDPGQTDR